MEFKDMQVIWNSEKQETLFAIDETALHAMIKRKGKSITRWMERLEWLFIAVNFLVALFLLYYMIRNDYEAYRYAMPLMCFGYSIFMVVRKRGRNRQQSQMRFEETMLGEVDKAIWQLDYLLKLSYSMAVWYLIPIVVVSCIFMFFNPPPLWVVAMLLVVVPLSFFASHWELNRFYLPMKRELESLRETITSV